MKHQLFNSAEPPRGGEAQKALLSGGGGACLLPQKATRRLGLKNTSLLVANCLQIAPAAMPIDVDQRFETTGFAL